MEIYILWTDRTLQPMIQYTVITKDITKIDGNNKLEAILIYAYIKSRENYKEHMLDNLTYEEISHHLDVPVQTVKNIVPTLYGNKSIFKKVKPASSLACRAAPIRLPSGLPSMSVSQ